KIDLRCIQCLYHVWINADISMMERVIQNLVENALKSTPEGGSVEAMINVDAGEVIFTIKNTGEPLAADLVQWINNFRSEGSILNSRPPRLGLGLLIVQKILLLHNATLYTQFQNGRNIFTFRMLVYNQPGAK
ncbi:MAG: ATP-binding protein, partial [Ferruginibacter sp.]